MMRFANWLRRLSGLTLALCVLVVGTAHAAGQESSRMAVTAAWENVRDAVVSGQDLTSFDEAMSTLVQARDGEARDNLESASIALSQWAYKAVMGRDMAAADKYSMGAVELSPNTPEGYLVRSTMFWKDGDVISAAVWFSKAAAVGVQHYWVGLAWLSYGIIIFWIAAATTLLVFLVPSILYSIRAFQHMLQEFCYFKLPGWVVLAGLLALVAMPLAAGLNPGWVVLAWIFIAWMGDRSRDRHIQMFLLLVVLMGPWLCSPFMAATRYHSDPVEIALAESQGTVYESPGVVPDVDAMTADMNWRVPFILGNIALRDGRYGEAAEWYEKAQALGGDPVRLTHNLASARFKQGKVAKAEELLKRVTSNPEGPVESWYNLGQVQSKRLDFVSARASFDQARAIDPDRYLRVTQMSADEGDFFVMPMGISGNEARAMVLSDTSGWAEFADPLWKFLFGNVPVMAAPGILVAIFILFWLLPRLMASHRIYHCDICSEDVCQECMRFDWDLHLCGNCIERIGETRGTKTDLAILRDRYQPRPRGRVIKKLLYLVPGIGQLEKGRFATACLHLLVVSYTLWWMILLGTVPQWALSVPLTEWPVARLGAAALLALYTLLALILFRIGNRDTGGTPVLGSTSPGGGIRGGG